MAKFTTAEGFTAVAVSVAFFGSFGVFMKMQRVKEAAVSHIVFQVYMTIAIVLSSLPVLAFEEFVFTYWGFVSASLWVPASLMSLVAIKGLGLAQAQGMWSGLIIAGSFTWGAGVLGDEVKSPGMAVLGLFVLGLGIAGLSLVDSPLVHRLRRHACGGVCDDRVQRNVGMTMDVEAVRTDGSEQRGMLREDDAYEDDAYSDASDDDLHTVVEVPGDGRAPHLAPPTRRQRVMGVLACFGIGVCGGSMLVPVRYTPDDATGINFVMSFSFGAFSISVLVLLLYALSLGRMPALHWRACLLPGMGAGLFWNIGNIASLVATLSPLGLTVGYPLTQCALLVGGLWGLFYFKEFRGAFNITQFFISAAVMLGGATLLSVFGTK